MLIQSDGSMKNPDTLCCGFYLIKANKRTIKFLKPLSLDNYEHDQDYFNKEKANINYKLLPHNFFPNGRIFYKFKRGMKVKNFNPYLIHFNWVKKFYFKEKLMKKFDMWYLDKKKSEKKTFTIYFDKTKFNFASEVILLNGFLSSHQEYIKKMYFSGKIKNLFQYDKEKDLYEFSKENIKISSDARYCDAIILPYKFKSMNDPYLIKLNNKSITYNKPLLIFYNDDDDKTYELTNNMKFYRTSFYKSKQLKNEYGLPAFTPDYFNNVFLENPKLTIGYCGHIRCNRQKYINLLANSELKTNFIIRRGCWAPGVDKKTAIKEYYNTMESNIFIFCYRGVGNFSYRFFEILMMGRIPIIVDTDCVYPFSENYGLENIGLIIKNEENLVDEIKEYYNKNKDNLLNIQKNNRKIWEEYLSPIGFIKQLIK